MSKLDDNEPACTAPSCNALALVVRSRLRDIGAFSVRRLLPSTEQHMVGPFIFFDHMGPADLPPGKGLDVRPHPHINLATVTYLFEGEIMHRDSLGSAQVIQPGAVNWMIAGRGIAHSERSPDERRRHGGRLHGIQAWVALPKNAEEMAPRFDHHDASTIPVIARPGVDLRLIAGTAYGAESPVKIMSPTFYVAATLDAGASIELPAEHVERAAYVAEGRIVVDGQEFEPGAMAVLRPHGGGNGATKALLRAAEKSRVMLLGGAPLDGPRYVFWNFVSSSKDRIERAKKDWKEGRFQKVAGDEKESIPLPE
ncbi:MAG: pirin family protein [Polyangiaceae bacterium]|nr:pirin family protein [Polyangiaceae bacterium]